MLILSHRGYWRTPDERNTLPAFERSFRLGFGTETDLRDLLEALVVSHDPPAVGALPAEAIFHLHRELGAGVPLALNVKSDGLQSLLVPLLERFGGAHAFVFDVAVPDALAWLRAGVPTFTRHSEVEPQPAYYNDAAGVWLDAFHGDWWDASAIGRHLDGGKRVCVVSPELHGRDPRAAWDRLAAADFRSDPRLMLCTDRPEEARGAFGG